MQEKRDSMTAAKIYGDDTIFDGKISYILYFTLFPEQESAQRMKTLKADMLRNYPMAHTEEDDNEIFRDFKIVQEFLHGGGLPFQCWRLLLCNEPVTMEKAGVHQLQVMFTAFPEINIGKMTFNLQFQDAGTSQMVYLHHCNGNGAKITFKDGTALSISEMYQQVLKEMNFYGKHGQLAHLIEINRFGDLEDVAVIMQQEKKRMYGIISGDEGWNHIPEELADARI